MTTAMTATMSMPATGWGKRFAWRKAASSTAGKSLSYFVALRDQVRATPLWQNAFAKARKDRRYYDIVEDTMHPEITHRYLMITDQHGHGSVQPFFITSIDMAEGLQGQPKSWIERVRSYFPGFLKTRVLMVGCVAGEGVLDGDGAWQRQCVPVFKQALVDEAYKLGAGLIVFKEFRSTHRSTLDALQADGFARVPSMPMTRLHLNFASFDEYMSKVLSSSTRKNLRRKFKAIDASANPLQLTVSNNIAAEVDELYPLYLQIYERSGMHFEKLTKEFLVKLGETMPDRVRYFVWRQNGKPVAFSVTTIDGETICDEYIGIDYASEVASSLYHYTFRDIVTWAIENGLKTYASTGLSYDPKLHLKQELVPLDLYVRHRSPIVNFFMKYVVRFLDPTRQDKTLPEFANYADL